MLNQLEGLRGVCRVRGLYGFSTKSWFLAHGGGALGPGEASKMCHSCRRGDERGMFFGTFFSRAQKALVHGAFTLFCKRASDVGAVSLFFLYRVVSPDR